MEAYYGKVRGKVKIDNYRMIKPVVRLSPGTALLTYDYEACRDAQVFRMHCTEVYAASPSASGKSCTPTGLSSCRAGKPAGPEQEPEPKPSTKQGRRPEQESEQKSGQKPERAPNQNQNQNQNRHERPSRNGSPVRTSPRARDGNRKTEAGTLRAQSTKKAGRCTHRPAV